MNLDKIYRGLLEDLKDKKHSSLGAWEGGMEARGIDRYETDVTILEKYILNWHSQNLLSKFAPDKNLSRGVIELSGQLHSQVLRHLFGRNNYTVGNGDYVNAQDYYFIFELENISLNKQTLNVLDFGAGYSRAINFLIYLSNIKVTYFAVDAVLSSYISQYLYLKIISEIEDLSFNEFYLSENLLKRSLNHLPTWQMENMEKSSIDLVLCSQVLPELDETVFTFVVNQICRVLKDGGKIYIRDHGLSWMPGHQFDTDSVLRELGFIKTYEYFAKDQEEIHGIPRIYTKTNARLSPHNVPQRPIQKFDGF